MEKTDKFEIDMLSVGAADAILIHFYLKNEWHTVLIDAGNYSDGELISDFVVNQYGSNVIDLAICTHCDKDHFGGFIYLCEQMRDNRFPKICIKKMLINDPGLHVSPDDVKYYRKIENLINEARSVYDLDDKNLLLLLYELASDNKIDVSEAFSDSNNIFFDGLINIVGPTKTYYEELTADFRNDLLYYEDEEDADDSDANADTYQGEALSKALDEASDDSSAHNQSSIIFTFNPNLNDTYLFMGDAGRNAFDNMAKECRRQIENTYWLKVPHHGSKHNMDSDMINWISPRIAFVSTEKRGHYLNYAVVRALKKCGCSVYSTHRSSNLWHHHSTENRSDYSKASPL